MSPTNKLTTDAPQEYVPYTIIVKSEKNIIFFVIRKSWEKKGDSPRNRELMKNLKNEFYKNYENSVC